MPSRDVAPAHLRIRNHGKLFAATLRAYQPGNPWIERI